MLGGFAAFLILILQGWSLTGMLDTCSMNSTEFFFCYSLCICMLFTVPDLVCFRGSHSTCMVVLWMGKWKSVEGNVAGLMLPTCHCQRDPCAGCGSGSLGWSARAPPSGMRGLYFTLLPPLLSLRISRLGEVGSQSS